MSGDREQPCCFKKGGTRFPASTGGDSGQALCSQQTVPVWRDGQTLVRKEVVVLGPACSFLALFSVLGTEPEALYMLDKA